MTSIKSESRLHVWLACILLLCLALWVACNHLAESGLLWPDSSQYLNAAAMIHDWLLSGNWLHPYQFAKQNYVQYPGFHMPYHPPVYPGLLGAFFVATGVSQTAARVFVALSLWICGCSFFAIMRRLGHRSGVALICAALLVTLPDVAYWSRDAMSEIPSLALILTGTYFFLRWMESDRKVDYLAAFAFAEAAFLSRYLTAGVMPVWFLWLLLTGKSKRLRSAFVIALPVLYGVANAAWVLLTRQYSVFETSGGELGPNTNYTDPLSGKNTAFYFLHLPTMIGWPVLGAAMVGVLLALRGTSRRSPLAFWMAWLASYTIFVLLVGIYEETRYFMFALPVFPGLVAELFGRGEATQLRLRAASALCLGCLVWNIHSHTLVGPGSVGSVTIAHELAKLTEPGNVLMAPTQAQLMFYYRSEKGAVPRRFIRADRTLTTRPPNYSKARATAIATDEDDVMDIISRGRVRYLLVAKPSPLQEQNEEQALLNKVLEAEAQWFERLSQFQIESGSPEARSTEAVQLWKFTGMLPDGPSTLPVVVPTADLTF